MPDPLTPEERAAIAAYRGRVQRCKPGVYSGDAPVHLSAQIHVQYSAGLWRQERARKAAALRYQEALQDAPRETPSLSASDASRILEGADDA